MNTQISNAIIASTCESVVSASYALAQAHEKMESAIGSLAGLVKPNLTDAANNKDFSAWEAIRKPIQTELAKKYKARGASDEVAANNADKRWSEVVAKLGLTKPASESKEATKKQAQRQSASEKALAIQKLAEGKTPAQLLTMAQAATTPDDLADLSAAAKFAVNRDLKAQKEAEKKAVSESKKAANEAVKAAMGATPENASIAAQAVKFAAERPDAVAAFAAVYDRLVALQVQTGHKVGGKVVPASMLATLELLLQSAPTVSKTKATKVLKQA